MTFNFNKLTEKAQNAVAEAQAVATNKGNPEILPLHLLHGLIQERDGVVRPLLEKMNVDIAQLEQMVQSEIDRLPSASGGSSPGVGQDSQKVLQASAQLAGQMGDEYISTEHLLLAIGQEKNSAQRIWNWPESITWISGMP